MCVVFGVPLPKMRRANAAWIVTMMQYKGFKRSAGRKMPTKSMGKSWPSFITKLAISRLVFASDKYPAFSEVRRMLRNCTVFFINLIPKSLLYGLLWPSKVWPAFKRTVFPPYPESTVLDFARPYKKIYPASLAFYDDLVRHDTII